MAEHAGTQHRKQRKNRQDGDPLITLSKSLSWLLRHGADSVGLTLLPGGFLYVSDIMQLPQFSKYTVADVEKVVATNDKQRFFLTNDPDNGRTKIRANQGHTVQVEELDLTPIRDHSDVPTVIHGTNMPAWEEIKSWGLSKMKRNHIHFAVGEPGDNNVISGMRTTSKVLIYIDMNQALQDGIQFFESANNVILSPGLENGIIPPGYFKKVVYRPTGEELQYNREGLYAEVEGKSQGATAVFAEDFADQLEKEKKSRKKKV